MSVIPLFKNQSTVVLDRQKNKLQQELKDAEERKDYADILFNVAMFEYQQTGLAMGMRDIVIAQESAWFKFQRAQQVWLEYIEGLKK